MDTEALRLFVLASDKLNISAAGRDLGYAPAVASAKLAKLEKSIGADLLHRSTRKVSLSLEGSEFLPFAREILAQEDAARAALGQGQQVVTGTVRFTAPSTFSQLYIAPLLPAFLDRYPGISLDLRLSDVVFDLIDGSFDLALRNGVLENSSLIGRKLASDQRILCASPRYLEFHGRPKTPEDLSEHRMIAFKSTAPSHLKSVDGRVGVFDPSSGECRLIIDDGLAHKQATIAGSGIALHSIWSVHQELSNGSLVRVLNQYQLAEETVLWLLYPKANVLSAKVRVLIDFLLAHIGQNPPWCGTTNNPA